MRKTPFIVGRSASLAVLAMLTRGSSPGITPRRPRYGFVPHVGGQQQRRGLRQRVNRIQNVLRKLKSPDHDHALARLREVAEGELAEQFLISSTWAAVEEGEERGLTVSWPAVVDGLLAKMAEDAAAVDPEKATMETLDATPDA